MQFLLWTIGGLYFSWSNMDEIHGDLQKKNLPLLCSNVQLVSPTSVLDSIRKVHRIDSIVSIQLIEILGQPIYQIRCIKAIHNVSSKHHETTTMNHLANAETGLLRGPLTKDEAIAVAIARFNGNPKNFIC
jgi:ABC-type transporter Mla MlaB component